MGDLVKKASVHELCAHRERAIALYGDAIETLGAAISEHRKACQMGGVTHTPHLALDQSDRWTRLEDFLPKVCTNLDRDMWSGVIKGTPIGSLMDKEERKAFEESLRKEPPPATVENITATMERLCGDADTIFRRGLVNAFKALNREYASNDGFKIGERIVMTWGVSWDKLIGWFTLHQRRQEELHDIDRVMHVLDGKESPTLGQGLIAAIETMCYRGKAAGTTIAETPYWRVRIFKNGNIHLWPLRKDLLDKANRIVGEHYGMVVPAGHKAREAQPDFSASPDKAYKADFFATPEDLAHRVVDEARIVAGMLVLEPSAGEGALAHAADTDGGDVLCIEKDPDRAARLVELGYETICADFLDRLPTASYDRVVMNPPFSAQQDVRHVIHALKFLKPGGRLVAIMGAGVTTSSHLLARKFREHIERMGGVFEPLPEGSFKESGTGVRTVLLTVDIGVFA